MAKQNYYGQHPVTTEYPLFNFLTSPLLERRFTMKKSGSTEVKWLTEEHRSQWNDLIRQYKQFYNQLLEDVEYDLAWQRIIQSDGVYGVAAFDQEVMVGVAHYLFHTTTWERKVCYLQDLFVDESHRGQGIAKTLIEHIALTSRSEGATKFYWLTQDDNQPARLLYDRVAKFAGFIRYDYPLDTQPLKNEVI